MTKMKIILVILMIGLTMVLFFASSEKKEHNGVKYQEKYHQWSETSRYGKLLTFPEKIPDDATVKDYYYSSNIPPLLSAKYQIYLNLQFSSSEAFDLEVDRLKNIKEGTATSVTNVTKDIKEDNEEFSNKAYVAMMTNNDTYEYAIVDNENNTIIYIYLQSIKSENVKFSKEFLPKNYGEYSESFSIYG